MTSCRLSWALCGVLAGCAAPTPAASASAAPVEKDATAASDRDASLNAGGDSSTITDDQRRGAFADMTESPRHERTANRDHDEYGLATACGQSDAALFAVAQELLQRPGPRAGELDVDEIQYALRRAGSPYVWPRAWLLTGRDSDIDAAHARMQRWLASFADGGERRCGVALRRASDGRLRVVALAVDALADLHALPTHVRVGQWLDVRAELRVPANAAKVVVLGPYGAPRPVPTELAAGVVRARFNADQPGTWLVQLLAEVEGGPRPVLEASVLAGTQPSSGALIPKAPGEEAMNALAEPTSALYQSIDAARRSEGLPLLARDSNLQALAHAHAEAMHRARKTAHDAGDGDLNERLTRFGLELVAGENVAHAASARLAARALWASPSHRENLLFPDYDSVGVGAAPDNDGTVWVCQVFAKRN